MEIKKQIYRLLFISGLGSFEIAGASWVALMASRHFSLVEIGFAESCFHLVSLFFEIPSGVISDVFGRKKSLILSQCMFLLSAALMIFSSSLGDICLSMGFCALGYNFASGTREALAYDSLLLAGREQEYLSYSSLEFTIYRIGNASAVLCAGLALFLGYRRAYLLDILFTLLCLCLTLGLREVPYGDESFRNAGLRSRLLSCFRDSFRFLKGNRRAKGLMLSNALLGAFSVLLVYFLQAQLPGAGLSNALLGPSLFFIGLGGALGARIALRFSGCRYPKLFALCSAGMFCCIALSFTGLPLLMAFGGFLSSLLDDLLQIHTDAILNHMFPSSQRATLISVSSLCFSLVMIGLSPLVGWIFSL